MIRSFFKWALRAAVAFIVVVLIWANVVIHFTPAPGGQQGQERSRAQFHYLKGRMHGGVPQQMQQLFPEGAPFAYALYGLLSCNLSATENGTSRDAFLDEARWCLESLDSDQVKGRFPILLAPDHGAFLAGWTAYLHGSILRSLPATEWSDDDVSRYRARCDTIAGTFARSDSPYIESYNGMAWPADAMVCVAALAQHDALLEPAYANTIQDWVREANVRTDALGMLPHAWDPWRDSIQTPARGSSMALMNVFLPMIDSALARDQYRLFKEHFLATRMGLPAMLEYPRGTRGHGDIDSGPLILGIGPAATIVGAGACRNNGDPAVAHSLESTVDAFGFAVGSEERRYLFGALPIADLFIAWCRSMSFPAPDPLSPRPRSLRFHAWSTLIMLLLLAPWAIRRWRRGPIAKSNGASGQLQ